MVKIDPGLSKFEGHLKYRYSQFLKVKKAIDQFEGGLEMFAEGLMHHNNFYDHYTDLFCFPDLRLQKLWNHPQE